MRSMSEVMGKGILCSISEKLGSFNLRVHEILELNRNEKKGPTSRRKVR